MIHIRHETVPKKALNTLSDIERVVENGVENMLDNLDILN